MLISMCQRHANLKCLQTCYIKLSDLFSSRKCQHFHKTIRLTLQDVSIFSCMASHRTSAILKCWHWDNFWGCLYTKCDCQPLCQLDRLHPYIIWYDSIEYVAYVLNSLCKLSKPIISNLFFRLVIFTCKIYNLLRT